MEITYWVTGFLVTLVSFGVGLQLNGPKSKEILKQIVARLEDNLSDPCMTRTLLVLKKLKYDELVAQRCEYLHVFGISLLRITCHDLDMRMVESAMCGTTWPENKVSSIFDKGLTEKNRIILQNILNDLTNLEDKCSTYFTPMIIKTRSNSAVRDMCGSISLHMVRDSLYKYCSVSEYDTIKKTICNELDQLEEEEDIYSLSTEASKIFSTMDDRISKTVSRNCWHMFYHLTEIAKSDVEIYGFCRTIKSAVGETLISEYCNENEYKKMAGVVCATLETDKKIFGQLTFNTNLSHNAASKFQKILDNVYGLSETCFAFVTNVVQTINTDSQVDDLCDMTSWPSKSDVLKSCSNDEFKMFNGSACSV